ncbi:MAG TPA: efflux RND transporter permease subunit [Candidatus Deferrimicrobium sp.]|nr:efflux RND transporter permease subunit [Candidatus Deferrimicrobium sp.]
MKLAELSIKRPVFATMMVGALLVLGAFSYTELSVDLWPEIDFPIATIVTVYPGASAESMESDVTKKIEDAVNEVSGVRHITSQSREGFSLVIIEFELERKGIEATQDVREKVAGIRADLPDDIEEPIVSQFDPGAMPILSVAVAGERPPREVTELVKNVVKKRLESVPGAGSVVVIGEQEREILLALDLDKMESYRVTVMDVQRAVAAANLEVPGGRVDEASREYVIRTAGRLTDVDSFRDIIVKNKNGSPIYLKDMATVSDTVKEQRSLSRYNGQPAVALNIIKQSGANTVEVAHRAKQVLAEVLKEMPPDIRIDVVDDNSRFIEDSIHEILFNIRFGTLLAVLVIFLFLLNIRPTIITGLAIPVSFIATFTLMKALGFTLNMMTLMGLSLAVGILIDDAIVVIENIYRHMSQGKSARAAALDATKEIGLAVVATTFSIVVVFVPIAFMSGIVGRFFYQFGMCVAFAVVISLFIAFTLTPMLSSRFLEETASRQRHAGAWGALVRFWSTVWRPIEKVLGLWNFMFEAMKLRYEKLLAGALRMRWLVVLVATLAFGLAFLLARFVGTEFMPQTDQAKLAVEIDTPPGTNLAQTSRRFSEVEQIIGRLPEVTAVYTTIGAGNNPVTRGRILVKLTAREQRTHSALELMDSVRMLLREVPGIKYSVGRGEGEGGSEKPIEISIRGDDIEELTRITHQVQAISREVVGTTDVDNTLEEGKPEVRIEVDRRLASDLDLNLGEAAMTIRSLVEGDVVTRYREGDEEYDVRLRLDEADRSSKDDLGRILIRSNRDAPDGGTLLIPLDRVARLTTTSAIGQYNRFDRQREVRVNANVLSSAFAGSVTALIEAQTGQLELPPGYRVLPVGLAEIQKESFGNIFKALVLSVIFIYLLLASLYESFIDPFSIMVSLPLSLVGAVMGLVGSSFSIVSLIGIVLLMGLVTKNAILLIDFVKQQRQQGVSRFDAILKAGPIRLRPILMTTFAMVFGMLPLALGIGPGAEIRAPMARAAIGGIISSTLLTLVMVPVVYTLIEDFFSLFRKRTPAAE